VHPGDLAGGFSNPEMTWLLYCVSAATDHRTVNRITNTDEEQMKDVRDLAVRG